MTLTLQHFATRPHRYCFSSAGLPIEKRVTNLTEHESIGELSNSSIIISEEDVTNTSEGNQCGGSNHLEWVLTALILVVPISLVLIACCCCSCCAFCKICSCLQPSKTEFSKSNLKTTRVYFEPRPCVKSQSSRESVDSVASSDTMCPLFPSLSHPPPIR